MKTIRKLLVLAALAFVPLAMGCAGKGEDDRPAAQAEGPAPSVRYSISIEDIDAQLAAIEARFPVAGGRTTLYMPVWTPGYYVEEDYKKDVVELRAFDGEGRELPVEDPGGNRWLVDVPQAGELVVRYVLSAKERSVSRNEIAPGYAVFNGSATYVAAKGSESLRQEVRLDLPQGWTAATGLRESDGGFVAENHEELLDSPIMAGDLEILDFESAGTPHLVAYNRGAVEVDKARMVADLKAMAEETRAFWAEEPWRKYAFLIAFRSAGGGLEHRHSTFVNVDPERFAKPAGYGAFRSLLAHEYQHAFNVKRLRPVELGPFDYENIPSVSTLWISEGLTSYYSNLMLRRSGLIDDAAYLGVLSRQITGLQNSPGRLKQSLEQSSLGVWTNSNSGVGASDETVSYYIKGEVAGFLLDAHIRKASDGGKSLDDAMRLAYARYSGDAGFRPEEFQAVAEEATGVPLADWFASVVGSATEVDYAEALDWFGLALEQVDSDEGVRWQLSVADDADADQRDRLREWLAPGSE